MANKKNFATGLVATAPDTPTAGTELVLESGHGARMPDAPFFATVHPADEIPTTDNAEVINVTDITGNTLTIERAQKSTTAKPIEAGWRVTNAIYVEDVGDVFGPAEAVDGIVAIFDGTTGKLLKISRALIDFNGNLTLQKEEPGVQEARAGLNLRHTSAGVGTSQYRLSQTEDDFLRIRRSGDSTGDGAYWTLIDFVSPTAEEDDVDSEATLSLTTRMSTPEGVTRHFDIYNDEYSRDNGIGFRQIFRNTQPNPYRWEYHDRTVGNGSFTLGEIYAYVDDMFFISVDSERTGREPGVDDWVWDNPGIIFADDTKIIGVEPNTPSAGLTTYHINRAIIGEGDPGTARGRNIHEIMRLDGERRLLVRKYIADGVNTAAEFGKSIKVDGAVNSGVATLEDDTNIATDASLGNTFRVAIAGNRTLAAPSNPTDGQRCIWEVTASGAARTLSLDTGSGGFVFGDDVTELTETPQDTTDLIGAIYHAPSEKWRLVAYTKGF